MGARTYVPQLLAILQRICKYIVRYNVQIKAHIPDAAKPKLDAIVDACNDFTELIPPLEIGD